MVVNNCPEFVELNLARSSSNSADSSTAQTNDFNVFIHCWVESLPLELCSILRFIRSRNNSALRLGCHGSYNLGSRVQTRTKWNNFDRDDLLRFAFRRRRWQVWIYWRGCKVGPTEMSRYSSLWRFSGCSGMGLLSVNYHNGNCLHIYRCSLMVVSYDKLSETG